MALALDGIGFFAFVSEAASGCRMGVSGTWAL
jgi:hypothetical protein